MFFFWLHKNTGKNQAKWSNIKGVVKKCGNCQLWPIQLVRVHKYHVTKKQKQKNNAEKLKGEIRKDEERKEELNDKVDVVDVEPNSKMEKYVLSVVNALTLKDGEVLLGIA